MLHDPWSIEPFKLGSDGRQELYLKVRALLCLSLPEMTAIVVGTAVLNRQMSCFLDSSSIVLFSFQEVVSNSGRVESDQNEEDGGSTTDGEERLYRDLLVVVFSLFLFQCRLHASQRFQLPLPPFQCGRHFFKLQGSRGRLPRRHLRGRGEAEPNRWRKDVDHVLLR